MSGAPITNPSVVLSTTLYEALSPFASTVNGVAAVFWLQATQEATDALLAGTIPGLLVTQLQTPLRDASFVDGAEITTTLMLRAVALTDDGAQTLLADAVELLARPLTPPIGFAVQLAWTSEVLIPSRNGVYCAACTYRTSLRRA